MATDRGDTTLTAYVVARPGPEVPFESLRRQLQSTLNSHALPSTFVHLDALPLTPEGRVDRVRLAQAAPPRPAPREASASETEAVLAEIWADALETDRVGHEEDLFLDLGGDSLAAAVIAAGVHASFGVDINLQAVAESSTVTKMAELVERLRSAPTGGDRPRLSRASRVGPLPASFKQESIWEGSLQPQGELRYTMAVPVRITGPLDVAALRHSVDHLFRRHELLRTTFARRDGRLVQVVHPPTAVDLPLIDLSATHDPARQAASLLTREARVPFDLAHGPLLRLRLARITNEEHQLFRVSHHIISDALSWKVFFEELGVLYEAYSRGAPPPLPDELPLQYGDYAAFERRWLDPTGTPYRREVAWWSRVFTSCHEPLVLPFGRATWRRALRRFRRLAGVRFDPVLPADDLTADNVIWWELRPETSRALERVGRKAGATYFMVRLAAFAAQLALETGREDLAVGIHVTNRRLAEVRSMFGDFSNVAALRLTFCGNPSFREWLAQVKAAVIEMSSYVEVPHELVTEALALNGIAAPELAAIFGVSQLLPPLRVAGLEITQLKPPLLLVPPRFTVLVDRWHEIDRCQIHFDRRSYDPSKIRSFVARFERFLGEVSTHPDRSLSEALLLAHPL
jgi:acyl carrier protein